MSVAASRGARARNHARYGNKGKVSLATARDRAKRQLERERMIGARMGAKGKKR